ncbi:MAG: alpha/beta hydrolase [bacterium]|nr:alpha/beta hydrolase [bacterium]
MEIKKFGNPEGKTVMLLHGNLMCWRQFEDVIPLLEKEYLVFAVSFDGFDGTGKTTYTTAGNQAEQLAEYISENCGGRLDMLFAESLGCGPAVLLSAIDRVDICHMILSGPEYLDYGVFNGLLLKVMPQKQYKTAKEKTMPAWAMKFMGQTEEGFKLMMSRIPDNISLESIHATWEVGLNLYRTEIPVRPEAKVACWYGEKEGHMKKAIEKLKAAYPRLTVRCFQGYGHGDIINHPQQLADEMVRLMNQ